jgi:hypothetical protein
MSFPVAPIARLTWHLARSAGRRELQGQLLAAGAAAISALALLLLLAAYLGSDARADRTAWRTPVRDKNGTALQALSTTFVRGEPITVVELAQLPGRAATPAPPGLASFPAPGQVYLSPSLATLVRELPADQLADRFPKPSDYGTVGRAGLAAPNELVAVVGRAASAPVFSPAADNGLPVQGLAGRAVVSGFSGITPGVFVSFDRQMTLMGIGLLVVPVIVLASASGRLGAARREQRLAGLRLAGATPRQILTMTAIESAAVGAAGAVAGTAVYGLALPVLAKIPYGVGDWFTADLWVGPLWPAAVIAVVALLTSLSAVSALRQVATSPLGVAQQSNPRRTRLIRLMLFAAIAIYVVQAANSGHMGTTQQIALLILAYGAFWVLGPWVVDRIGRVLGRLARRPATLLAARRLSDDPRGAWRTVSGLVLAGLVAGFFSTGHLATIDPTHPGQIAVSAPDGQSQAAAAKARRLLRSAGVTATVRTDAQIGDDGFLMLSGGGIVAQISGGPAQMDTAATALASLVPGQVPYTDDHINAENSTATQRLGQLGIWTLALGFLVAASSAGLTAAATVLDRRRVYGLLRLAGTPLGVLDKARIRETLIPLVVLAGGTTATGVYAAMKLNEALGVTIDAGGGVKLAACVVVGAAAMFAAITASRPLLRAVTADPAQSPD